MGRRPKHAPPTLRRHSFHGHAYVQFGKKQMNLGPWGSQQAKDKYAAILKEWAKHNSIKPFVPKPNCKVSRLVAEYLRLLEPRVSRAEHKKNQTLLTTFLADYYRMPAADFGKAELKAIRAQLQAQGRVREQINKEIGRIRRCFKWGVNEDMVPAAALVNLQAVPDLAIGEGIDNDDVQPVPIRDLIRVSWKVNQMIRDMIFIQVRVGMRPGELCAMRGEELHEGSVRIGTNTVTVPGGLLFAPTEHKNKKRKKILVYLIGPRAKKLLEKYQKSQGRMFYAYKTYHDTIQEACRELGIPEWSPGRLRHNYMGRWERLFGIEAASASVSHSSINTTAIYVQKNLAQSKNFSDKIG